MKRHDLAVVVVYWLILIAGLVLYTTIRSSDWWAVIPLWLGAVGGTALGHALAVHRLRLWLVTATIVGILAWFTPYIELGGSSALWMAFIPGTLCAYWSLGDRMPVAAFWFPSVIWMLSILDGAAGTDADASGIVLLGGLAVLFVGFLAVRESRRVSQWRTIATTPLAITKPVAILKEKPGRHLARAGWALVVSAIVFALTAWVAPHLWQTESFDGKPVEIDAPKLVDGVPCCPVETDEDVTRSRVREYLDIGRGHDHAGAAHEHRSCRVCDGPSILASIDPPPLPPLPPIPQMRSDGTCELAVPQLGSSNGVSVGVSGTAAPSGDGNSDGPAGRRIHSFEPSAPTPIPLPPRPDRAPRHDVAHAGTAPQPPASHHVAPPAPPPPPPPAPPAFVPADPQITMPPPPPPPLPDLAPPPPPPDMTPPPPPIVAPPPLSQPAPSSIAANPHAIPAPPPPPAPMASARPHQPPPSKLGPAILHWVALLVGAALLLQLGRLAFRPLRRWLTVRHLRRPFWDETVDQRVSNSWQLALVGLRDAGWRSTSGEAPREFARRVGLDGLDRCATILERARHGISIDAEDLAEMTASADAAYHSARRGISRRARAVAAIRWPLT